MSKVAKGSGRRLGPKVHAEVSKRTKSNKVKKGTTKDLFRRR